MCIVLCIYIVTKPHHCMRDCLETCNGTKYKSISTKKFWLLSLTHVSLSYCDMLAAVSLREVLGVHLRYTYLSQLTRRHFSSTIYLHSPRIIWLWLLSQTFLFPSNLFPGGGSSRDYRCFKTPVKQLAYYLVWQYLPCSCCHSPQSHDL